MGFPMRLCDLEKYVKDYESATDPRLGDAESEISALKIALDLLAERVSALEKQPRIWF